VHLAVDATGLKVYGEGEWKVRVHGKDKRRVWRKLHLAVDTGTGALHAHALTVLCTSIRQWPLAFFNCDHAG
jgi:hypothetical protein